MEALRSVFPVSERFLDQLVMEGRFAEAASLCPSVLHGSAPLWEWWIQNFIRLGQLPTLLPHIPTSNPQLPTSSYDAVLHALIIKPRSQQALLAILQKWPQSIYSLPLLITHLEAQRDQERETSAQEAGEVTREGSEATQNEVACTSSHWSPGNLEEAVAFAYTQDQQYDKALQVYLHPLRGPRSKETQNDKAGTLGGTGAPGPWPPVDVFAFIKEYNLFSSLPSNIIPLFSINPDKAGSIYAGMADQVPPSRIVPLLNPPPPVMLQTRKPEEGAHHTGLNNGSLDNTTTASSDGMPIGDSSLGEMHKAKDMEESPERRFLHFYLHHLFEKRPELSVPYQKLQVPLYADFDPASLLAFLRRAEHYPLHEALAVCTVHKLAEEQAYLLGRMGDTRRAMAVTLEQMHDVAGAVAYAREVGDEDVWQDLFAIAARHPELVAPVLEEIVGVASPVELLRRITPGTKVPGLHTALPSVSASVGCETSRVALSLSIIQKEKLGLLQRFILEAREGVLVGWDKPKKRHQDRILLRPFENSSHLLKAHPSHSAFGALAQRNTDAHPDELSKAPSSSEASSTGRGLLDHYKGSSGSSTPATSAGSPWAGSVSMESREPDFGLQDVLHDPWDSGLQEEGASVFLRCTMCLEPLHTSAPAVALFCSHAFHEACLQGGQEGGSGPLETSTKSRDAAGKAAEGSGLHKDSKRPSMVLWQGIQGRNCPLCQEAQRSQAKQWNKS